MRPLKRNSKDAEYRYKIRVMASVIAVELFLIALVHLWPVTENPELFQAEEIQEEGIAIIQTPVITRQAGQPPPPPSPEVPVEVPDEVILEEQEIEFLEFDDVGEADSLSPVAGNSGGAAGKVFENPETDPSVLYIVEPTIENRTDDKALIYVSFLVDKEGNVEEATINRILLFDDEGNPTTEVEQIDERVLSRVIEAALEWEFRPATENGQPVRTVTLGTFTVDY